MTLPSVIRPIPVEDVNTREPEWAPIMPGYGQTPTMRTFEHDPVHDDVRVDGPVVEVHKPDRPA